MKGAGLEVGGEDLAELASWLRVKRLAQALGMRACVVLLSGQGLSLREVAQRVGVSGRTVCLWRRRYRRERLAGLRSRPRSGRPRRVSRRKELAVVAGAMRPPQHATHWSARRLAKELGLSHMAVYRIWQKYGLQPHRVETFKFSTDPEFAAKLADIVGLYLDPPERALVLCVDEKRCPFDSPCYGGSLRASPGRALAQPDRQPGHPPRQLRQRAPPGAGDHPLARPPERRLQTLPLAQNRRPDQTQHS